LVAGKRKKSAGAKGKKGPPKPTVALDRTFGPNLRRCRKRAGYTQEALAERADMHRTQISLLERALRNPGYDTITRLIGALEVDPSELFQGGAWVPGESGHDGRFDYEEDGAAVEKAASRGRPKSA
jgi:transcriptional regulator with XRE-family HTH domain